jgi:hypothetical protein
MMHLYLQEVVRSKRMRLAYASGIHAEARL